MKTTQMLRSAGYVSVLKVHSKKAVHHPIARLARGEARGPTSVKPFSAVQSPYDVNGRADGNHWPEGSYHPSSYFLSGNRKLIHEVIRDLEGRRATALIMHDKLPELGFFAGTMFWVRLDAISRLLGISPLRFPDEGGQSDATMAHAVERLFTFLPQLEGRRTYTVGRSDLTEVKLPGPITQPPTVAT